ncbi:signal-regulatory protein beta-2-like [Odontesthes bonariensis]|uniref:signal-regulatory protein beta-2-like n=1 Tax=Odontesthes bonariensis TaxID=219752 RepID=UPI003F589291
MILVWVTLLLLHRGYSLVPVVTAQLGEPVTLTCVLPDERWSIQKVQWYKQSAGDALKSIVILLMNQDRLYGPGFSASKLKTTYNERNSSLTILKMSKEDEGMYHCAAFEYTAVTWSGTYLSLKANTQGTSNYIVVQQPAVSDPAGPGDSVSLQCSVLSDSENKTCSGDLSVFWFRAASNKSHPHIIYSDGNGRNECDKRAATQRRCVYHFSKNISSSDAGTYYCAVATCGEILFGIGTKLEIEKTSSEFKVLVIITICFGISVIVNVFFICYKTPRAACGKYKERENNPSQGRHDNLSQPEDDLTEGGRDLNYAALHFSGGKATRGKKKKELRTEESVYSQVKYQGVSL